MPELLPKIPPGLTTEGLLGRRYLARLIDSFLVVILAGVAIALASGLLSAVRLPDFVQGIAAIAIATLVSIGYGAVLECKPLSESG